MADTPWGDLLANDAHIHLFSRSFYEAMARQKKSGDPDSLGPLLGWEVPAADITALAEKWVKELDAHTAGRACLIGSIPGEEDTVAEAVRAFPDRFYGLFMFNPLEENAMQRLTAAAGNPHLHGVCFFPAMHTYSIADPRLAPMFEMISDRQLLAFVHCGALSVGIRKKLGLPSQFDMRFSDPLALHPVALHFPQVKFLLPHFGAGMLREALMLADLCPNVYLDTSSTNHWMSYEGLDLRTVFRRTIDLLGPERILFGTDSSFFPRGWNRPVFDQQAKALYELGLDARQATLIMKTNLERLMASRTALFTR
jgi:uncharacterized protein